MIRIDNWKLVYSYYGSSTGAVQSYKEYRISLLGDVTNHPKLGADIVMTSSIEGVKGRIVTTKSGSIYVLGRIDPEYKKQLKKYKPGWDYRNPIP